jgi:hypothetical protein
MKGKLFVIQLRYKKIIKPIKVVDNQKNLVSKTQYIPGIKTMRLGRLEENRANVS